MRYRVSSEKINPHVWRRKRPPEGAFYAPRGYGPCHCLIRKRGASPYTPVRIPLDIVRSTSRHPLRISLGSCEPVQATANPGLAVPVLLACPDPNQSPPSPPAYLAKAPKVAKHTGEVVTLCLRSGPLVVDRAVQVFPRGGWRADVAKAASGLLDGCVSATATLDGGRYRDELIWGWQVGRAADWVLPRPISISTPSFQRVLNKGLGRPGALTTPAVRLPTYLPR